MNRLTPIVILLALLSPRATAAEAPRRIVALVPSVTEMLFAVGLGDEIVGVDNFSAYPATAAALPKVGDYRGLSLESIAALRPTHVVLLDTYFEHKSVARLSDLGAKTVTCKNGGVEEVKACLTLLGRDFGREKAAAAMVRRIDTARRAAIASAAGRKARRVLLLVEVEPLYAVGPDNFIHELFSSAGFENVLAGAKLSYPQIGPETLLALAPDAVITFRPQFAETVRGFYSALPAGKRPQVRVLDEEIFARPGPRLIEAYEALAELHLERGGAR